jgi:hypothetical protein
MYETMLAVALTVELLLSCIGWLHQAMCQLPDFAPSYGILNPNSPTPNFFDTQLTNEAKGCPSLIIFI